MTFFDDLIADGLTAAESAWGTTFTVQGLTGTFTGTFDRHMDSREPGDGGYQIDDDATILANRAQFSDEAALLTEDGSALLTEDLEEIELEQGGEGLPAVGRRLTHDGKLYLITETEVDVSSILMRLKTIHR